MIIWQWDWLCTGQSLAKWKLETQFGKNSSSMLPLMIPGWVFSCAAKNSDHDTNVICQQQLQKPQICSRLTITNHFGNNDIQRKKKMKSVSEERVRLVTYSDGRCWGRCALPIQTWPSLVTSTLPSLLRLRQGEVMDLIREYWENNGRNIWSRPLITQPFPYFWFINK